MAKIVFHGDSMVLTSGITKDQLEKVAMYKPEALKLVKKEEGKSDVLVYRYGLQPNGDSIGRTGVEFTGKSTNSAGFLTFTKTAPSAEYNGNAPEWFYKTYGTNIGYAAALEEQIINACSEIDQEIASLKGMITVSE